MASHKYKLGPVSAYAIAKAHGFTGTEEEWLESLAASDEQVARYLVEHPTILQQINPTKGSVENMAALPATGNEINDSYYVQDLKYMVTWTGSQWVQTSMSETAYSGELGELGTELRELTGNELITAWTTGYYYKTNVATASTTPLASASFRCKLLRCKEGDAFTLNVNGGSAGRGWAFLKSDGTVLSVSGADIKANDLVLTAPSDVYYLALNDMKIDGAWTTRSYIGDATKNRKSISRAISGDTLPLELKNGTAISKDTPLVRREGVGGYSSGIIQCNPGDVFYINGYTDSEYPLWMFSDVNGARLSSAASKSDAAARTSEAEKIIAPAKTAYLSVNNGDTLSESRWTNKIFSLVGGAVGAVEGKTRKLAEYNSKLCFDLSDFGNFTMNSVQVTVSGETCRFVGTPSASVVKEILKYQGALPPWAAPGKGFFVTFEGAEKIKLRVYYYTAATGAQAQLLCDVTSSQAATMPADANGLLLQLYAQGNVAVDETIRFRILSAASNEELQERLDTAEAETEAVKAGLQETGYTFSRQYVVPGAPFYYLNRPMDRMRPIYKASGSGADVTYTPTSALYPASDYIPCPKYLLFRPKPETAAAPIFYFYVGTLDETGAFTLDEAYVSFVSSGGYANRFPYSAMTVEIANPENKVFYYSLNAGEVEAIGADEWPTSDLKLDMFHRGANLRGSFLFEGDDVVNHSAWLVPQGCWIMAKGLSEAILCYGSRAGEGSGAFDYRITNASAVYVPEDCGLAVLTVGKDDVIDESNVFLSIKPTAGCAALSSLQSVETAKKLLGFSWVAQDSDADLYQADGAFKWLVGKRYYGVPYSALWSIHAGHWVGFEVSPETAANAANDAFSIFYNASSFTNPSRHMGSTHVSGHYSTGYGLVCSTFVDLVMGVPYPMNSQGCLIDENFAIEHVNNAEPGKCLLSFAHILFVSELLENGVGFYEATSVGANHTVLNSKVPAFSSAPRAYIHSLDDYYFSVVSKTREGFNRNFLNFDYQIIGGGVRPWRGHKSVNSAASVENDGGLYVTAHGGAKVGTIWFPGDEARQFSVEGMNLVNLLEIKQLNSSDYLFDRDAQGKPIIPAGIYSLAADVWPGRTELFKFCAHDDVTLTMQPDGTPVFSHSDIDYAYVTANRITLPFYPNSDGTERTVGVSVIGAKGRYPGITTITGIRYAFAWDAWGRYPVKCTIGRSGGSGDQSGGTDDEDVD